MQAVFGYGSLCDLMTLRTDEKITRPLKETAKMGILPQYKIRLNKVAWNGKHSYCNIEYTGNDSDYVYGIILYLTKNELNAVNGREGYHADGDPKNAYNRFKLPVLTPQGTEKVYVYMANPAKTSQNDMITSKIYANHIIRGLHFMICMDKKYTFFRDKEYFNRMEKYYNKMTDTDICVC